MQLQKDKLEDGGEETFQSASSQNVGAAASDVSPQYTEDKVDDVSAQQSSSLYCNPLPSLPRSQIISSMDDIYFDDNEEQDTARYELMVLLITSNNHINNY